MIGVLAKREIEVATREEEGEAGSAGGEVRGWKGGRRKTERAVGEEERERRRLGGNRAGDGGGRGRH